ncbi:hypothetical protein N7499_004121 [Penicillium canescens]|uniref:Uncharacterized protein n=1 Tax=Penicillium canescens TaxID=5083 RepID=A0AAD6I8K8_PENCN|nr:uncharacterized protein N7446_012178 [Penicillium canescens]KAJ6019968.1 hypothetical protein N7522_000043 [Penicillium canescens]KAJ6037897.1 hypothetical protein N7460_007668 [Penicillium canescens]KAJ6045314.1 hypothetical protein N7446_012178 [Penicillium canescens]KAJ6061015.1 hypothetical protein N7444_001711 [Penicillium canescens]KAJ6088870.1 hypothetical protein N7499_004121 [Penicillium canescens]
MGIIESKILVVKLATACSVAEQKGQTEVQHVLSDQQVVDCLAKLWKHLPDVSKQKVDPSYRKRCRKAPRKLKDEKIDLSKHLKANMARWSTDIRSFLYANGTTEPPSIVTCPVAGFYEELSKAEIRNSGDAIRLRFLKVLFHHLKDRFCVTYLRPNAVEWITQRVLAAGLDDGDSGRITCKIKDWAYVGGRYEALSRDLGDYNATQDYKYLGSLFRLPDDVTDRYLLKEVPVKGEDRTSFINSLTRRGVCNLEKSEDTDNLANEIFCYLWNKVESSISFGQPEQGSPFVGLKDWRRLQGTRILRLQNVDHPSLHFTNPAQNSESAGTSQCTPVRGELGTDCVQQVSSELETPDGPTTNRTQASEIYTSNLTAWDSGVSGANEGRPSGSQNVGTAFQDSARMFAQIDQERTHFNPTTSDEFFSLFPNPQLANPEAQIDIDSAQIGSARCETLYSRNVSA